MSTEPHLTLSIDPTSAARLAEGGLHMVVVDTSDAAAFEAWLQAEVRGFHEADAPAAELARLRDGLGYRRTVGVYDDTTRHPETPVATVSTWPGQLSVPGGRALTAWAISAVTVAPTHRRRGMARALLEAELRTAAALGLPVAMLTVSEATIYGRFGFGPAAMASDWRIDTRRTRWAGPAASGRVQFVGRDEGAVALAELHERTRLDTPGQIDVWTLRWQRKAGMIEPDTDDNRRLRVVTHVDDDGVTRGVAIYRLKERIGDFAAHTLVVEQLAAETPDASAALWRFLLEVDLVAEVTASLRSADEPLRWQLSDQRGATVTTYDHLWLRIVDVAGALTARGYTGTGALLLDVDDELGYAAGRWLLTVAAGVDPRIERLESVADAPAGTPIVALSAAALGSLFLGGVSAATLAEAGRLRELTDGAAAAADGLLRSPRVPWLSVWF